MKFGVLADIHGNLDALMAIIKELQAQDINYYIFAGDLIADCDQPNEVLEYIQTLNAIVIKGNREEYVLDYLNGLHPEWDNHEQMASVTWTAKILTQKNIDYIKSLKEQEVLNLPNAGKITIVHGSPFHISEHLYEEKQQDRLKEAIEAVQSEVLVCGHSHTPWTKQLNETIVLNPGAAGVHFNQDCSAEYAILSYEEGQWHVSHHVARYDFECFKNRMLGSSLYESSPTWTRLIVQSLGESWNANIAFLRELNEIYSSEGLIANEIWHEFSEKWFLK